jgi:hypothetical protein
MRCYVGSIIANIGVMGKKYSVWKIYVTNYEKLGSRLFLSNINHVMEDNPKEITNLILI